MKKIGSRLLSLLTALALCIALLPPAPAQAESLNLPTEEEAIELLRTYRVARGDEEGNLHLEKNLTRAEAATLFVRAMGREEAATGTPFVIVPFTDAQRHWGAPYIAEVAKLGLMKGDPTGNFRPEDNITYAEVLTVLFRMAEMDLPDPWTPEAIFTAAQAIGLAPVGTEPTQNAARGKIFWSLASTISRIQLPSTGKTLMQMHLDTIPPDLTLDETTIITREATITISGTSFEAEQVLINGKPINRDKNGRFTLRQNVKIGNLAYDVVAIDRAGNENAQQVVVSVLPPISRIDVVAPAEFKVGSETKITVKAFDSMGQEVSDLSEMQASTTGDVATYDPRTGTLFAGNLPGKGTLVLKWGRVTKTFAFTISGPAVGGAKLVINPNLLARPFATGKDVSLQIQVQDANNKLVTTDNFRPITLSLSGLSGARLSAVSVETKGGTATVIMQAPVEGTATLTASSPGLPTLTIPVSFLTSPRIVLSTAASTLLPDGAAKTKITAALQDEAGRPVNASDDLVINLSATGAASTLTGSTVTIKKGTSRSNETVELVAGFATGEVQISGSLGGLGYSIQPAKVTITGSLNARKLVVTGPTTAPTPGTPTAITLKVVDNANAPVTAGSYAFQFEVRTEQNDPLTDGLPAGVTLTFAGSTKTPVDDGRAPTDPLANPDSVVGRTVNGQATLTLTVPAGKSGKIILTPKVLPAQTAAFNPTGDDAPALASTGLFAQPLEILFLGAPHHIELTANSQLGTNMPAASSTGVSNIQVTAKVVDLNGYTIPGNTDTITLTRLPGGNDVASISSAASVQAVNGVARFTITTKATVGFDQFQATNGAQTSDRPFTVAVRNTRPLTPNVARVAGATATTINATGLVTPTDTHLALELFHQDPQLPGETSNWVTVFVYRKGEGTPLLQGVPVNLADANPIVRIPRTGLPVGTATYEFVLFNGAGYSDRSPDLGLSTATIKDYSKSYPLRAAYLDAVTGTLDLTVYNLPVNGKVDVSRIYLVKDATGVQLDPARVTVGAITNSGVTLNLGAQLTDLHADYWNGSIKVFVADAWFDGLAAGWITAASETPLQPAANIARAAYDPDQQSLYLYGTNLNTGTLQLTKLAINKPGNPAVPLTNLDRVTQNTGTMVRVQLSAATQAALAALGGNDLTLSGDPGWLVVNGGKAYNSLGLTGAPRPVNRFVQITGWKYDRTTQTVTITGRGLNNAQIDPQKLKFEALGEVAVAWSPTLAPVLTAVSDTTVSFTLTGTDVTEFEANFTGRQTYLNSLSGWLVDPLGRPADLIPDYSVLFGVPR